MNKVVFLISIFFSCLTFAESSHSGLAVKFLEVSKVKEQIDEAINTYAEQLTQGNPNEKTGFANFLQANMGWNILKTPIISFTQQNLTRQELVKIIQFYETPEGKVYADKNILLNNQMGQLISENIMKTMSKLPK